MSDVMRKAAFAAALLFAAVLLFVAFARPSLDAPFSPARTVVSDPNRWETAEKDLRVEGAGVVVRGADTAGATLLMQPVTPVDAATLRYLEYDLDLGRVDKAYLLWRVGGQLRNAALPAAGGGAGTLDLHALPGWEGEIDAIGVLAAPADIVHPSLVAGREFAVRSLRLASPSWRGALGALWNEWTAYRPWTGRSINTGGFELAAVAGPSLTLFLAVLATIAMLLALALFGRGTARRIAVPIVGLAALCLALVQFTQLRERGVVAGAAAASAAAQPQFPLSAQPVLASAAAALSERLRSEPGRPRVFVAGESQFLGEYATWLLREHNAAMTWSPEAVPATFDGPAFLVVAGKAPWEFDVAAGRLTAGERHWLGELIHDGGVLRAYRIAAWEAAP